MTTTSIRPGCNFCRICTYGNWGDGYTDAESKILGDALVAKFEELARTKTGDNSISWQPYTSEIIYECWGQTTREHHCMDSKHPWPTDEDGLCIVDLDELLTQAQEWVGEHLDEILRGAGA